MADKIRFENSPVVEVVCGVSFKEVADLKAPHLGDYWGRIRKEFPEIQETSLLIQPNDSGAITFGLVPIPPLPRIWFISEDNNRLIQVQRDRFLFNWKRSDNKIDYPSFDNIFPEFKDRLKEFTDFVADNGWSDLIYKQFEVTYVNHIETEIAERVLGSRASNLLIDHVIDTSGGRFLPEPSSYRWTTSFDLPDEAGGLAVTAGSAVRQDGKAILRFELTAKSISKDKTDAEFDEWFELAHQWIVNGFADLTSPTMQNEIWKRQK